MAGASATAGACPLCGGDRLTDLFSLKGVPALCNQLWPTEGSARDAAMCDVDLVLCEDCTLISNRSFDPARIAYAPGYENALHFSPRFRDFAEGLVADLVTRHGLAGKDVVEIGCGDGHILSLFMQNGARSAAGFDPSANPASEYFATNGVELVQEYFRSDQLDRRFDALLCRHVLEHLPEPMGVLEDIRRAIGDRDCAVYFEVPNAEWMLESLSIWDVIYEHVTYWGSPAITTLMRRAGFGVDSVTSGFGGQFLMAEMSPGTPEPGALPPADERARIADLAQRFSASAAEEIAGLLDRLGSLSGDGKRAVIWGAGSKGITFANIAAAKGGPAGTLEALVDVNARKHGLFVPGTGLPVVAPDALSRIEPDLVLVSNELYLDEIRATVGGLGLAPEFGVIAG